MREIKTWDDVVEKGKTYTKKPISIMAAELKEDITIHTREGTLKGYKGDFLIRGVEGEIYPCGREIFFKTYQEECEHDWEAFCEVAGCIDKLCRHRGRLCRKCKVDKCDVPLVEDEK